MAASASIPRASAVPAARERAESIPWYIWFSILGATSAMIGVHWDISWHRSIGRDTFWTAPHIAIQLCGVIAAITCGYLIFGTTFTKTPLRAASVNVLGFRAPLGAFICAWGGLTMIASAPFDDWWHKAYGLDVKILSPPHVALAIGILAVETGTLVLIVAYRNRTAGKLRERLEALFFYAAGMILIALLVMVLEYTHRVLLHTAACYMAACMLVPVVLAMASRATGRRWAATTVAAFYTGFMLALEWILPIFPAQPKLGPVLHEVTQFIPNGFPLLIIVPAIALDMAWPRIERWKSWRQALICGILFLSIFWALEWPFGDFLQSPAARNAVFGSIYYDYNQGPQSWAATYRFPPIETTEQFQRGMVLALVYSFFSTWLGIGAGGWLKRVRR